jgi:integrase/recombinase XerD
MNDPSRFQALKAKYLHWLKQLNYAARTIQSADDLVGRFIQWCGLRGLSDPAEVTRSVAQGYQRWLFNYRKRDGKPLKPETQALRLVHVHNFFKWLLRENQLLFDPMAGLILPRLPKSLPRHVLSHAHIETIINSPDTQTPLGVRNRAILETLYSTGLRRAELAGMSLSCLDLDAGMITVVQGKGGKMRRIPIGKRAAAWLDKYLLEVRPMLTIDEEADQVFLSATGRPMSGKTLGTLIRNLILESGVETDGACHLFRHSMATHMLDGGADIRYIQAMLGHEHLVSTQIYTHVSIEKLKEVHARTHPARLEQASQELPSESPKGPEPARPEADPPDTPSR